MVASGPAASQARSLYHCCGFQNWPLNGLGCGRVRSWLTLSHWKHESIMYQAVLAHDKVVVTVIHQIFCFRMQCDGHGLSAGRPRVIVTVPVHESLRTSFVPKEKKCQLDRRQSNTFLILVSPPPATRCVTAKNKNQCNQDHIIKIEHWNQSTKE